MIGNVVETDNPPEQPREPSGAASQEAPSIEERPVHPWRTGTDPGPSRAAGGSTESGPPSAPDPDVVTTDRLDQVRRGSFNMPNRITLDAERASLAGHIRTAHIHDKTHRPIHIDVEPGHASAFHHSLVHYVSQKHSQDDKLPVPGRDASSKTSVIEAFLGAQWSQPRAEASDESPAGSDEEGRQCQPTSPLFFPHYVLSELARLLKRHTTAVRWLIFMLWLIYVIYAVVYNFYIVKAQYDWCHDGGLISWTSVVILVHLTIFKVIVPNAYRMQNLQDQMHVQVLAFLTRIFSRMYVRIVAGVLVAIVILFIAVVGHLVPDGRQLIALCGYFVILLMAYLLSVEPEEISWGVVARNLLLQVLVVYLMMVWRLGRIVLECIANKIAVLFSFSAKASWVLFHKDLPHMLSIELLSSLTLTGSIMHLLYYTGLLQGFLHKTGMLLELITGTTTVEAVSGALCTLFGGIETAVILEPYIVLLTMSELHTFITTSIAMMTGVALTMYMDMGVEKVTLMTVNFATFNGSLAVSKVLYPETDTSVTTYRDLKFLDRDEYGVIDAGVRGALAVLRLLAQLIAALIAFIALVNMVNDLVEWLLENVGIHGMDVVGILSLILRPLIFLMGIEWQSSDRIARLFATKTVLNEYFAYKAFLYEDKQSPMQTRECAVTVALLYGFSNLAHVGATVAYLTALAPERRRDISSTVPRALLAAILTNLLTAALVGAVVSTQLQAQLAHHGTLNVSHPLANGTIGHALFTSNGSFLEGLNTSATVSP